MSGDIWIPPRSNQPLIAAAGIGAEMRLRPIFFGGSLGFGGGLGSGDVITALFVGGTLGGCKLEMGTSFVDNSLTSSQGVSSSYRGYFVGVAGRFGRVGFVEPSAKVMLPATGNARNLFLVIGVQLGVGFDGHK